ncbi:hypothetical protein [Streptomyces sp. NPDC046909]|uniref:hypothetical protein n=1 Tax=Streptomyces sp. NPDC046909 TaxID=3155617 RepID=UPI0033EEDC44
MALAELRRRLMDGLAHAGLTKTQLARQANLGRTTVQEAFQPGAFVPSASTVLALAGVLRLPGDELLNLRRAASGEIPVTGKDGPGKPVGEWNAYDLEVHPAGLALRGHENGKAPEQALPGYVSRDHDQILAHAVRDAARGQSRMVVLVGTSSTGKTRACWEAVQPLANQGWRLWHPFGVGGRRPHLRISNGFSRTRWYGSTRLSTTWEMAQIRDEAGDHGGADALYRLAADVGDDEVWRAQGAALRWPHGLEPDGTPTQFWK